MLWLFALLLQGRDEVRVSSHAYVPQSPYTLRVDTKLVEIEAVVRDFHGKSIAGLTKDDFRILDGGKERLIEAFEVDTTTPAPTAPTAPTSPESLKTKVPAGVAAHPPTFLALFFDDVNAKDGATAGDLKRTQIAAAKFVKDALKADVRIGIFTASGTLTLDFTTDEAKLAEAIAALKAHVRMREGGLTPCPWIPPYIAMRIVVDHSQAAMAAVRADAGLSYNNCPATRDSIFSQAEETWLRVKEITADTLNSVGRVVDHLAAMPGKRELLMASSGFLGATMQEQTDRVIDKALRAGIFINVLDSKGLYVDSSGVPIKAMQDEYRLHEAGAWVMTLNEPMANLADATGGKLYQNNNDLNAGFRQLGLTPEVTYRIGFRPDGVVPDGSYHKLKVKLIHVKGNYSMQARPGYFAPNDKAAESLQSKIDREILTEDTVAEFPVGIAVRQQKEGLSVVVNVDITKLRFAKQGDRQVQRIAFTTALIDGQGRIAAAKEGVMDLALTEATYKRLASTGVNAVMTLRVPAGVYKLRQVAEEAVEGKIACSTHPIDIK
jgi:VWFA-related protein